MLQRKLILLHKIGSSEEKLKFRRESEFWLKNQKFYPRELNMLRKKILNYFEKYFGFIS